MAAAPRDLALPLLAGELLRRVAEVLGASGIAVMPLKGVLWQRTLYGASEPRPMVDVDVIVPAGSFERARQALLNAGFSPQPNPQGAHEQAFSEADLPIDVDLHRSLFARGRYALDNDGLFARARVDETLFGVELWLPDPRDQLAHLIGHLATDHRLGDEVYRGDFERLIAKSDLPPEPAAEHLLRHGLARAARFALPELATPATEAWAQRCHAALGADPWGELLARTARRVVARTGRFSAWSSLAGHGLNTSLARACSAAAWAAAARVRAARL